jgi:diguanylate cyclase (GGDEF)-like protein/PAS domain S-box-containing protein
MTWLTMISNGIALLACVVALLAVFVSLRRPAEAALVWQGRAFPLLLIGAFALRAVAEACPDALARTALLLGARLAFLAAATLVWPLLRQFATNASQAERAQVQSRLELARAEASESRHWLQMAEKIARVGHWRYCLADRKLTWSDEVFSIFGVRPESFVPDLESWLALVVPEDRAHAAAGFEKALLHGSPFEITVRVTLDGEIAYVTARGLPELDETGGMGAVFGVFVDVTAQKRIEEELKNAHQASEHANRALEALARHDSLTMLANRRHFDETIALEFRRAARETQPIGLIMIDLDHFKAFNDRYGHPAGDTCLRQVAEAIAAVPQRPADLVARYGGEEIVVMLPNTNLTGTETVADLIVRAVRALRIVHADNPERIVTVSCGAAAFEPENDAHIPVQLIERADQALYTAKRAGRNRAVSQAVAA